MAGDLLVRQAREIQQRTAHFPLDVLLAATAWLERHHQLTPGAHSAIALALQYFVLAMRPELHNCPSLGNNYLSRAVQWREEATRWMGKGGVEREPQSRN
jgi:hypothetical protein